MDISATTGPSSLNDLVQAVCSREASVTELKAFLAQGPFPEEEVCAPLMVAASFGRADCLALLMSKEEEAFQPFLSAALSDVWTLLMATGLAPHQDGLVTTSIKFLSTVANSVHHALFADANVLQNLCEKIIAPNVQLLAQDEELFDDNPFEFVRRDVEGSDTDTRRRVACDLVRALCRNYEQQVCVCDYYLRRQTRLLQTLSSLRGHGCCYLLPSSPPHVRVCAVSTCPYDCLRVR